MELIRENTQKKRKTYRLSDRYRKVWEFVDTAWLYKHVELLNNVVPNFVLDYGNDDKTMWLDLKIISGRPASEFEHTDEFIERIYKFCMDNIKSTIPYAHGDWVLSNIIIDGDQIQMCDWDNLNVYPKEVVITKMHNDLKSAFGEKFNKVKHDSASI
jgi:aminoglycoside phosphotransferase